MSLKVDTHISGSYCVVWRTREHYLDCRSVQAPWRTLFTRIEAVRNGQVYRKLLVPIDISPETIIKVMREEFYDS